MKAVVIIALAFVALQVAAKPIRFRRGVRDADKCIEDLDLNKQEIFEISNRNFAPENHEEYTKFMKCYWKAKGYLKQDGSVNYDALKQMIIDIFEEDFSSEFSRNVAETVVNQCKNIHANSAGLRAIKTENCVLRNLKQLVDE